jgi:hypothetical protein
MQEDASVLSRPLTRNGQRRPQQGHHQIFDRQDCQISRAVMALKCAVIVGFPEQHRRPDDDPGQVDLENDPLPSIHRGLIIIQESS